MTVALRPSSICSENPSDCSACAIGTNKKICISVVTNNAMTLLMIKIKIEPSGLSCSSPKPIADVMMTKDKINVGWKI